MTAMPSRTGTAGRQAAARSRANAEGEQAGATAYSRSGQGEPLVLLHGIGSSRDAWDAVVPALAERFDVIAVDLPGFGASAPLPAGTDRAQPRWPRPSPAC